MPLIGRRRVAAATIAVLALAASAGAHAERYAPAALQVLSAARAASGGNGWNYLRGWHETGHEAGLAYQAWLDPLRYGLRVETREPAGLGVWGFNGGGEWRITPAGQVTGVDQRGQPSEARTEAFFRSHAYFYTGRFDAKADLVGVRREGGAAYDVVRIQPVGGLPRELWFDRKTHLLSRMVDRAGGKPVTTSFSDYRKVGPVRVAFHAVIDDGTPGGHRERVVDSLTFVPADRAIFSLPRKVQ